MKLLIYTAFCMDLIANINTYLIDCLTNDLAEKVDQLMKGKRFSSFPHIFPSLKILASTAKMFAFPIHFFTVYCETGRAMIFKTFQSIEIIFQTD